MQSSLPAAFSIRQKLPSRQQLPIPALYSREPMVPSPRPSIVRHRLRAVLPETTADAEAESLDSYLYLEQPLLNQTCSNATEISPSEPLAKLVKGLPAESVLLLNVVAVIWGSQHPIIKMVVDDCDASAFSLVRFGFAAFIASLFTSTQETAKEDRSTTWRWGAELGLWMLLGYAFQAIGLEYTTAQRSGFLLYLNVKFVPFFARILLGRQISIPTWVSAFVAVLGTALLSYDGISMDLNVGDLWSIAAAATSAMFILRMEAATTAVSNSAALNAACLWVVAGGSLVWALTQGMLQTSGLTETIPQVWDNVLFTMSAHPVELVYLSAVTTALANYIQTRAQRDVSAERACVIYAMDPVYGAIFSYFLLGERLSGSGVVGAALITIAAATNAFLDLGSKQETEQQKGGDDNNKQQEGEMTRTES